VLETLSEGSKPGAGDRAATACVQIRNRAVSEERQRTGILPQPPVNQYSSMASFTLSGKVQCEADGTLAFIRDHIDAAMVKMHHGLNDRQAETKAFR
jgi:hypothetical protein